MELHEIYLEREFIICVHIYAEKLETNNERTVKKNYRSARFKHLGFVCIWIKCYDC